MGSWRLNLKGSFSATTSSIQIEQKAPTNRELAYKFTHLSVNDRLLQLWIDAFCVNKGIERYNATYDLAKEISFPLCRMKLSYDCF